MSRHDAGLDATDLYAGAGGSTTGMVNAGYTVRTAANHWDRAIETHSMNHPGTEHIQADISQMDMRRLPRTRLLWISPSCVWHSPAGGRKRIRAQLDLLDDYVHTDGGERSRATAFDVIRASEVHRYEAVIVENVIEMAAWELFDWWLGGMTNLGYRVQFVSVSAAHVGGLGNDAAPQWRDRLYMVFTRAGVPLPDVDPRPQAWCRECGHDVPAKQSWKRPGRRIGKYRQQYLYICPISAGLVEPYVRPAAAIIDWNDPGQRIGDRDRPLAPTTMAKIAAGLAMFEADPHMLSVTHADHGRHFDPRRLPLPTRSTKIGDGLVQPAISITLRRNAHPRWTHLDPLATMSAGGRHHGLIIPYRKGSAKTTGVPLHTVATRVSAGLVRPADGIEDAHFRMLTPREQLAAQRFPATYKVAGNQSEQTMQAGNAVACNVAQWLGGSVAASLGATPLVDIA